MIIGGGSRSNWKWFSKHLMNGRDNELVRVAEIRGLPVDNIRDAFEEMRLIASAAPQCKNFFYHADLNTRADERLDERDWDRAVDMLEKNLGLEGQSRVVIEHDKKGRVHRHVVWSRIDPDTMRAIPDSNNYDIHMRTADELEKLFGHERTGRGRGPKGRNPDNWEVFRGKKSGLDPYDIKAEITELWQRTDSGQALAAALAEHGYILARGDRGLCIVDATGQEHSLARRIDGARKRDVDARMADLERSVLPSVEDARKLARERAGSRKRGDEAPPIEAAPQPRDPSPTPADATAERFIPERAPTTVVAEDRAPEPAVAPPQPSAASTPDARRESPPYSVADFEQLGRQFTRDAALVRELGQAVASVAESTVSEFERAAAAIKRAWVRGGAPSLSMNMKRLEDRIGREPAPIGDAGSEFRRVAEATKRAMRENGGEPVMPGGMTFWQRTGAVLSAAYERAVSWTKDVFTSFVDRVRGSGNAPQRDRELER